jgi:hypothetical protein
VKTELRGQLTIYCALGQHCVGQDPVCAIDKGLADHPATCCFCGAHFEQRGAA